MSDPSSTAGDYGECPIGRCDETLGEGDNGHWMAEGDGFHTFHTDKRGIARLWEHRDGLDVTPNTEPFASNRSAHTDSEK